MQSSTLGSKPEWLTFDCYGTLIQWDEGLTQAVRTILARRGSQEIAPAELIRVYDAHEHALEEERPHRSFRDVAAQALRRAMGDLGLAYKPQDSELLTSSISRMPPFPEVVAALASLKRQGFRLCIISNTDDDIIAGNVAQLGGHIDRVVTAQQAEAYKPTRRIFAHAHAALGVGKDDIVHICASPHLDLAAARDIGFRCIWIDRGTGRKPLADYRPDRVFPTLDRVPALFAEIGWA
jgi:2-haloacid dehalogenase